MTISSSTIRVFYDGACPLCRREVRRYQMLMSNQKSNKKTNNEPNKEPNKNEEIDWVDISNDTEALKEECINYDDAMRLIHIKDGSGVHQVGLEAMLTLWDKIPYYRKISGLIRKLPKTHPLLAKFYEYLAKHRMTFSGRGK